MAKIFNLFNNGGKANAKTGEVNVNSFNVSPDTVTAAPVAATLTRGDINVYDYFKVAQTSAATDEFDLPTAANIGEVITIYAVSAFELRTELDADKINNVTAKGYATTAGDLLTCTKVASDNWMVTKLTILGAAVTIVAAIAP